jgi:D-sedoheptulose 7-phosphate isomerase
MTSHTLNALDRAFTKDAAQFADRYFTHLKAVLDGIDRGAVARFAATLLDARARGATLFFIGNGGSAATASHFANDLAIGTRSRSRPFRVVSLTDNVAVMTAIGNDFGYDDIFSRQLRALAQPGDVLVGISASGNSPNLVAAFEFAAGAGLHTVALTAFDGGRMKAMAAESLHVPTEPGEYGPAEDAHLILNHVVGNYLMRLLRDE